MEKAEAIAIAKKVLAREIDLPPGDTFAVTRADETGDGWLIECNSKRFIETDDLNYALVIAPIFVSHDGSYTFVF